MLKRTTSELTQREILDTIRRMALMAEFRDETIHGHLDRMRSYTYLLARGIGLALKEADLLATASMLHDVGKVGLPEAITLKSGKLTPYELELAKRHTVIGADILTGSPYPHMQVAEVIAMTHHERWDGSGYPRSLRGEDIPLSGRICALADVFDALTTKRSYKQEMSVDAAVKLLNEASGTLFDQQLVAIFNENFSEVQRIHLNYPG